MSFFDAFTKPWASKNERPHRKGSAPLTVECLEDRQMLSADVSFRVWTQNAQLRPSEVSEVFPGGEVTYAAVSLMIPTVWALSEGGYEIAVPNTADDNAERADFILDRIAQPPDNSKPYDIIALQEVNDPDQVDQIQNGAGNLSFSYFSGPDQDSISIPLLPDIKYGGDSGLALLVSNEIPTLGFAHQAVEYEAEGSLFAGDAWANKGFTLDILLLEGNPVYVVNTHLHAQEADTRAAQLRELRDFVNAATDPRHPVLFMGDFNVIDDRSDGSEYRSMLSILGAEDTVPAPGLHTNDNTRNPYAYHWGDDDSIVKNRLDYILVRQGTESAIEVDNVQLEDTEAITDKFRDDWYRDGSTFVSYLSDHFGLSAKLRLVKYSTLNASTGALSIAGGAGNSSDVITVNRSGSDVVVTTIVRGNTYTNRFAADQVTSIAIATGAGIDTVNLEGLPAVQTIVSTGAGTDTINVGRASSSLANLAGADLVVSSTDGFDRLNVYDRQGAGGAYTVTANSLVTTVDTPSLTIAANGHDQVQLDTSDRNDRVYVRGKQSSTHLVVNAGNGADRVYLGSTSGVLQSLPGTLHVNGQGGGDLLYVYDYGSAQARDFTVWSNRIVHAPTASPQQTSTITYAGLEQAYVYAGSGNDTFRANSTSLAAPTTLYGRAGNDTLVGPNADSTWNVTGYNYGTLNTNLVFSQVENLTGNQRSDEFRMGRYGSVSRRIDGGGGTDTLDYSSIASPVRVDLTWGTATNVGGGAWGGVRGIENATGGAVDDVLIGNSGNNVLRGGAGNDELYGQSGHDVLVGGWGRDKLYGGYGRDLLIGGTGADGLDGGNDDDVLIAGTTAYDNNDAALSRVLAEWTSSRTYDQRVSNVRNGSGLTIGYHLDSDTVFKDDSTDTLTGGSQMDWFWSDPTRYVANPTPTFGVGLAGGTWVFDWVNDWDSWNEALSYSS